MIGKRTEGQGEKSHKNCLIDGLEAERSNFSWRDRNDRSRATSTAHAKKLGNQQMTKSSLSFCLLISLLSICANKEEVKHRVELEGLEICFLLIKGYQNMAFLKSFFIEQTMDNVLHKEIDSFYNFFDD